jgi:hypothetical protein
VRLVQQVEFADDELERDNRLERDSWLERDNRLVVHRCHRCNRS